ncbi:hypothetical protein FRB94_009330 [Tulasnella sp. JGI-2019a]|nr:hypothetical protein FRB94_009330 [Tulasnella sp. JGI-2019a]KAG9004867.1 hypothetical protein FRB93_010046 [Tulasnella sp. JGI-2019a]KAG9026105.1 hypothetical protein FRB95_009382 [Tulasnella sp. JGI-2019a]
MDLDDYPSNMYPSGASNHWDQQQQPQQQPYVTPNDGRKLLDLVFVQDCTGSQGSYIASSTKNIEEIYSAIHSSERLVDQEDLRIGLIAFRDHPPQDHTYITRNFGFSSDPAKVAEQLKGLYASGGGDGPEAVTAALGEALDMDWRPTASKMVVLIADAPPHGIGEYGDGFADGSPDGKDPIQIARMMASKGITLFFVACEPALSGYQYATDFYQGITGITSGLMLPLTTANLLAHAIIGSVLENLDMERLIREVGQEVAARILGNNESVDDVARALQESLSLRGESTRKVVIKNIYRESPEAKHNVQVWMNAPDLASARPLLKKVKGPRFTDEYLQAGTRNLRYTSSYSPYLPSRGSTSGYARPGSASGGSPVASSSAAARPVTPPTSPPGSVTSPSRRVISDFPSLGGSPGRSVFGTSVQAGKNPGLFGKPNTFAGMRGLSGRRGMMDDDDDDDGMNTADTDDDDGEQKVELRKGGITLDQARRIAMQSAWRSVGSES